ncbi:hypothetical protein [Bernardetia sp.]|uniref:hypothetical protein n=1 Tax=Bernardetia sp. TaxID=1937974 RepID=UPI0025BFB13D|nr:hypothetical protein [Bernardetia sp.]
MNLFFYKKYIFLSLFFLGLVVGFFRCVPIEDLLPPVVRDFTIESEYNVTETIFLNAALSDNFGIGSVRIEIEYTGTGSSTLNDTIFLDSDSIRARLVSLNEYRIKTIPVDAKTGIYDFRLIVTDRQTAEGKEPNVTRIERTFAVGGDNSIPDPSGLNINIDLNSEFNIEENLHIILLDEANRKYQACRGSVIPISGSVSDNVALDKISARFEGFSDSVLIDLENQNSVQLKELFQREQVKVPSVPNRTTLNLIFRVWDGVGNISTTNFSFLVDCDDQSPEIKNVITNPNNINEEGEIEVIEGQELFITRVEVIDKLESSSLDNDGKLKDLFIYFDSQENNPFYSLIDINKSDTIITSFNDSIVPIPSDAQKGDMYKIITVATDTAGNAPTTQETVIRIIENAAPSINVNNIGKDNSSELIPIGSDTTNILAGTTYRLFDKIIDLSILKNYVATWQKEQGSPITIGQLNDINSVEINFVARNIIDINDPTKQYVPFTVEDGIRSGTVYTLTIQAEDISGKISRRIYYFKVE